MPQTERATWGFRLAPRRWPSLFRAVRETPDDVAVGAEVFFAGKMTIRLAHEDSYLFTAIPVVACVMQYLENAHEPGFYFQSGFLKPDTLLQVLSRLGIQTQVSEAS